MSGGSDMTVHNPGPKLHRRATRPQARLCQLLCADVILADCQAVEGGPLLVKTQLRELLDELGMLVDTRRLKGKTRQELRLLVEARKDTRRSA